MLCSLALRGAACEVCTQKWTQTKMRTNIFSMWLQIVSSDLIPTVHPSIHQMRALTVHKVNDLTYTKSFFSCTSSLSVHVVCTHSSLLHLFCPYLKIVCTSHSTTARTDDTAILMTQNYVIIKKILCCLCFCFCDFLCLLLHKTFKMKSTEREIERRH